MKFVLLDQIDYIKALELQKQIHQVCLRSSDAARVLVLEHGNVLTIGKNCSSHDLKYSLDEFSKQNISLVKTDRGGQITAHMPGQMVVYPILNLKKLGVGVREYVYNLEETVIQTIGALGIHGQRDTKYPGVWVGKEKVCAIGVRVKNRVTMHGIAMNVNNDLSLFSSIVPCGIKDRGVTSVQKIIGQPVNMRLVVDRFLQEFSSHFGLVQPEIESERHLRNLLASNDL